MLKEIFLLLVGATSIAFVIRYLVQQSIWTRWVLPLVQRKANPVLTFDDGFDVKHIQQPVCSPVEEIVDASMREEMIKHPSFEIAVPSYENFYDAMFQGPTANRVIYNNLLDRYYKKKNEALKNIYMGECEDSFMIPVQLKIKNNAVVSCGKLKVTITPDCCDHVYLSCARSIKTGIIPKPPIYAGENCIPSLDSGTDEYKYCSWDFSKHIDAPVVMNVASLMHHDSFNEISTFYVDSRYKGKILIDWEIIEQNIQHPLSGEIVLWVD